MASISSNSSPDLYLWQTEIYGDSVHHNVLKTDGDLTPAIWRQVKQIGAGGYGVVWLQERQPEKELRAVKKISKRSLNTQGADFMRELRTLIDVSDYGEAFVQFYGWYQDQDSIYIAMEYVGHGDLGQYVKEFREKARLEARDITKQILEGLVILHEKKICHRDLKPQNVLIACCSPIRVKIADFGVSKCAIDTDLRTIYGTTGYVAPELLGLAPRQPGGKRKYTNAVDMWALGCVVYYILTLETPFLEPLSDSGPIDSEFVGSNGMLSARHVDLGQYTLYCAGTTAFPSQSLIAAEVTDNELDFVRRLLVADPHSRIAATEALKTSWLSGEPTVETDTKQVIRQQFLSLGIGISTDDADRINRRYGLNPDLRNVTPPAFLAGVDIGDLRFRAATRGYKSLLRLLLRFEGSCEVDFKVNGWTALQSAALRRHCGVVRILLDEGAGVNASPAPEGGRTALQAAAQAGSVEVVRLLLERQAEVNAEPSSAGGRTAIEAAIEAGSASVVKLLTDWGAQINARHSNGSPDGEVTETQEHPASPAQTPPGLAPELVPHPVLAPRKPQRPSTEQHRIAGAHTTPLSFKSRTPQGGAEGNSGSPEDMVSEPKLHQRIAAVQDSIKQNLILSLFIFLIMLAGSISLAGWAYIGYQQAVEWIFSSTGSPASQPLISLRATAEDGTVKYFFGFLLLWAFLILAEGTRGHALVCCLLLFVAIFPTFYFYVLVLSLFYGFMFLIYTIWRLQ